MLFSRDCGPFRPNKTPIFILKGSSAGRSVRQFVKTPHADHLLVCNTNRNQETTFPVKSRGSNALD